MSALDPREGEDDVERMIARWQARAIEAEAEPNDWDELVLQRAATYAPPRSFSDVARAHYPPPPSRFARRRTKDAYYAERREFVARAWRAYTDYLASDEWAARRTEILERDGHLCQACFAPADVVHHADYTRVFHEHDDDLVSLCGVCHDVAHGRDEAIDPTIAPFLATLS